MSDHLSECPVANRRGTVNPSDCTCAPLRACEQRVRLEGLYEINRETDEMFKAGYAAALDAASNQQWLRDIICANFFDGQEGGVVTLGSASEWMDEVSECLSEFISALGEKA